MFVDADSCPVKNEIAHISMEFRLHVVFVASYAHKTAESQYGKWIYVDPDKESADLYILNHVRKYDVVVTQDIGLASMLLPKRVYSISPRGREYKEDMIATALDLRYLSAKARRQGKYDKGPKAFKTEDRKAFTKKFAEILSKIVSGERNI
ncbi:DUF188 domain-containing protein [Heyndrickxia acidicola]|uniref:YaiI/YqxD family protein n=1 Tax=Heyndrickxia acidicola TaxID=209389 RepID=UPI002E1F36F6